MTETQMDRIENMLKQLIASCTTIEMKGTPAEKTARVQRIQDYDSKAVGTK